MDKIDSLVPSKDYTIVRKIESGEFEMSNDIGSKPSFFNRNNT